MVDLIGVTLVYEDANSKLLGVVSAANDVDAEECVDDSLVEILKRMFESEVNLNFGYNIEFEVCSRF